MANLEDDSIIKDFEKMQLLATMNNLNISKAKQKELFEKYKKNREQRQKEENELYQPVDLTEEEIVRLNLSQDFVDSYIFFSTNYKVLSEKYGDKIWLIIDKIGVLESGDNLDEILDSFRKKGYVGKAMVSLVGQKKGYTEMFFYGQ